MTPEQLAAIKARADALTPFVDAVENHPMQLTDTRPEVVDLLVAMTKTAEDVPALLAEVERLREARSADLRSGRRLIEQRDEALALVDGLRCEHCGELGCDWIGDIHKARAEAAEAEVARQRGLLDAYMAVVCACGHSRASHNPADFGDCTECPHGTCGKYPGILWDLWHRETLARAEKAEAAVERVRALHHDYDDDGHCDECGERRPCPTLAALDGPGNADHPDHRGDPDA